MRHRDDSGDRDLTGVFESGTNRALSLTVDGARGRGKSSRMASIFGENTYAQGSHMNKGGRFRRSRTMGGQSSELVRWTEGLSTQCCLEP